MEQKIYQNGFYLLLGLFIGVLSCLMILPKEEKPRVDTIRVEVINDSVKVTPVKPTAFVKKSLTEKNLKAELIKHNIPHANIVLAQAKLESGLGTSPVYKKTNNLFGLKEGNSYRRYSHWTECVKDYKRCISSRYTGGSYYAFLDNIGYAKDPNYTDTLRKMV